MEGLPTIWAAGDVLREASLPQWQHCLWYKWQISAKRDGKKKIKIKTPGVQEREKSAGFSFQHLTVVSEQSCDHFSSALWTVLCDCQWFGHWGKQRASRKPGTQAWDSAALWQSTESWWLPSLSSWSLRTVTSRMSHVSGAWDVLAVTLPWGWLLHGKKGS